MVKIPLSFLARARNWSKKHKLFGPQAFLRYVMMIFVDVLNEVSDDFVFKGGNLLWIYINTPRSTIDLDLATKKLASHEKVRKAIEQACLHSLEGVTFQLKGFQELTQRGERGAKVTISYRTSDGASNVFNVDIVYALPINHQEFPSLITPNTTIQVATIENIIADKLDAAHRFGSGSTRLKDYDDLWRLAQENPAVDQKLMKRLLKTLKVSPELDTSWIGEEMEAMWKNYIRRYEDLPSDLKKLFGDVNQWLRVFLQVE